MDKHNKECCPWTGSNRKRAACSVIPQPPKGCSILSHNEEKVGRAWPYESACLTPVHKKRGGDSSGCPPCPWLGSTFSRWSLLPPEDAGRGQAKDALAPEEIGRGWVQAAPYNRACKQAGHSPGLAEGERRGARRGRRLALAHEQQEGSKGPGISAREQVAPQLC
ncbi:hypothetical protein L7F22_066577 [Adiantum nelumboides]|nr:hypothetical protein [Adiantum nelumboides]